MPVYPVRTADVDGVDEVARLYRQSPHPATAVVLHEALTYSMPSAEIGRASCRERV